MKNAVRTSIASLFSMALIFCVVLCYMFVSKEFIFSVPLSFLLFGLFFLMLAMRKFANSEVHEGSVLVKRSTMLFFAGFTLLFVIFFTRLETVLMVVALLMYLSLSVYLFYNVRKFMKYK